jgi:hypothetical protein
VIDKGFLQGMKLAVPLEAFNGRDLLARYVFHLELTRAHGLATHQHRTRSAKPFSATVLGAGQAQVVA